jgi:hypothetical protein
MGAGCLSGFEPLAGIGLAKTGAVRPDPEAPAQRELPHCLVSAAPDHAGDARARCLGPPRIVRVGRTPRPSGEGSERIGGKAGLSTEHRVPLITAVSLHGRVAYAPHSTDPEPGVHQHAGSNRLGISRTGRGHLVEAERWACLTGVTAARRQHLAILIGRRSHSPPTSGSGFVGAPYPSV